MKVKIIADCTVDRIKMEEIDYASVPLTVYTDERSYLDDDNIDVDEMLDYLASYKGRSYSSCPGVEEWINCYEGYDTVYVVVLSGNISGTYNAAVQAAEIYCEKYPDTKIKVFDSLSAGPEVRLAVDKVAEMVKNGCTFEEICEEVEDYMKHTRVFFALKSFHNFAENGRVNKTVAAAAGLLGIRIMATASTEGTIDVIAKCRGESGTLKTFMEKMNSAGYCGGKVYIDHCQNIEFADRIVSEIRKTYPDAEFDIVKTRGLSSFYAEKGGILLSCECSKIYE